MWLRLYRWLERHRYTVQDGTRTIRLDKETREYLKTGDHLFAGGNYEAIWNLSPQTLSDELRIAIREAWQAGAIPGGPGVQPECKQCDGPVRRAFTRLARWGSPSRCWQGFRAFGQCRIVFMSVPCGAGPLACQVIGPTRGRRNRLPHKKAKVCGIGLLGAFGAALAAGYNAGFRPDGL